MVELHITYDEATGNVNVNGPVGNKGLCYLMLGCARDAIKDATDKANQSVIVPANGAGKLPAFVRKAIRRRR